MQKQDISEIEEFTEIWSLTEEQREIILNIIEESTQEKNVIQDIKKQIQILLFFVDSSINLEKQKIFLEHKISPKVVEDILTHPDIHFINEVKNEILSFLFKNNISIVDILLHKNGKYFLENTNSDSIWFIYQKYELKWDDLFKMIDHIECCRILKCWSKVVEMITETLNIQTFDNFLIFIKYRRTNYIIKTVWQPERTKQMLQYLKINSVQKLKQASKIKWLKTLIMYCESSLQCFKKVFQLYNISHFTDLENANISCIELRNKLHTWSTYKSLQARLGFCHKDMLYMEEIRTQKLNQKAVIWFIIFFNITDKNIFFEYYKETNIQGILANHSYIEFFENLVNNWLISKNQLKSIMIESPELLKFYTQEFVQKLFKKFGINNLENLDYRFYNQFIDQMIYYEVDYTHLEYMIDLLWISTLEELLNLYPHIIGIRKELLDWIKEKLKLNNEMVKKIISFPGVTSILQTIYSSVNIYPVIRSWLHENKHNENILSSNNIWFDQKISQGFCRTCNIKNRAIMANPNHKQCIYIELNGKLIGHIKLTWVKSFFSYVDMTNSQWDIVLLKGGAYSIDWYKDITSIHIKNFSQNNIYRVNKLKIKFWKLLWWKIISDLLPQHLSQISHKNNVYIK